MSKVPPTSFPLHNVWVIGCGCPAIAEDRGTFETFGTLGLSDFTGEIQNSEYFRQREPEPLPPSDSFFYTAVTWAVANPFRKNVVSTSMGH